MAKKKKKDKELEEAIDHIKERFGQGAIMKLKEAKASDVDAISTGSISLDLALGVGGIPRGRVVEIYGPEATGKTSLALHIIAEAQKKGGVAAFVDAEHALDPAYAKKIGVDVNELLISQPSSGDEALQIVETLTKSGEVDVIAIDSVAALTPKGEIEGEIGNFQIGLQARMMSQALRKLASIVSQQNTSVIFLNQTRMKVASYGNPETTSGGIALKFYSSVRIRLGRRAKIKSKGKIIGNRVKAKVVKNKVAAPFKTAEFDIYYNEGISEEADLIRSGANQDVVERKGAWYYFGEEKLGQGMEESKDTLRENDKLREELRKEIMKKVAGEEEEEEKKE